MQRNDQTDPDVLNVIFHFTRGMRFYVLLVVDSVLRKSHFSRRKHEIRHFVPEQEEEAETETTKVRNEVTLTKFIDVVQRMRGVRVKRQLFHSQSCRFFVVFFE